MKNKFNDYAAIGLLASKAFFPFAVGMAASILIFPEHNPCFTIGILSVLGGMAIQRDLTHDRLLHRPAELPGLKDGP